MALPIKQQASYWGAATLIFLLLLWVLGDVLLPFVVGSAIAYMLDPAADRLQRRGLSRTAATTVISLFSVLIIALAVLLVIPLMIEQAIALVQFAPELLREARAFLTERFPQLIDENSTLRKSLASLGELAQSRSGALFEQVVSSFSGIISGLVFVVVVPVVAFYMLLDWDRMVERIDDLLPRDHRPIIRKLAGEVDRTLASFVRGQLTVCLILGSFYAVALMLVGLNFGIIVGAIAGLISFIPFVGSIVGGSLAIGLALFQFWNDPILIVAVGAIFLIGQGVEGNVLTPKLVGGSVGLHPVWLLLALSAFGAIYGFIGMLVAVPVAAILGVLVRFGIGEYKQSLLYKGLDKRSDGET